MKPEEYAKMTDLQKLRAKIEARHKLCEEALEFRRKYGGDTEQLLNSSNELNWVLSEIRKIELENFLKKEPNIYTEKDLKKHYRKIEVGK